MDTPHTGQAHFLASLSLNFAPVRQKGGGSERQAPVFRLDAELLDVLEELARRARLDRSTALRELIRHAGARHELWPPPSLTESELVALLEERARAGSVSAVVTLLRRADRQAPPREASDFDELDDFAQDNNRRDEDHG